MGGVVLQRPAATIPQLVDWTLAESRIGALRLHGNGKMLNTAKASGRYRLAALSDCVVHPSPGASPLDFLPRPPDGKPASGAFRLGAPRAWPSWRASRRWPGRST
jgi:hypothetical protein